MTRQSDTRMGEEDIEKVGDGDSKLLEEFNESMLLEWLVPEDDDNISDDEWIDDEMLDDNETEDEEFRDSMLQEWLFSDDEFEDNVGESDMIEDDIIKEDIKKLTDEIKVKENTIDELKEKLKTMEMKASDESIKRINAERELTYAHKTIDGLLKLMEQEKSNKRGENKNRSDEDFVKALVMEKETRETVTGGIVKEQKRQKEKQSMNLQMKQNRKKTRTKQEQLMVSMMLPMTYQMLPWQYMMNTMLPTQSMTGQRVDGHPSLWARA